MKRYNLQFNAQEHFSRELYDEICEVRALAPNVAKIVEEQAESRELRKALIANQSGRLAILACDHPARMVLDPGDETILMGNRYEFLARILRVLEVDGFDGVMLTPDLFEDLMILRHIWHEKGDSRVSLFDERILIGSMNRSGLKGAVFELDDRFCAFTAGDIYTLNLDGAKMMWRYRPNSRDSLDTMEQCARAIERFRDQRKYVFLEAMWVDDENKSVKKMEEIVKVVSVAQSLGGTSRNLWLKLDYCEDFEQVALSTTCPILLLGGSSSGEEIFLREIENGLAAGPNVRGVMVGRNVLFPQDGKDPKDIAQNVVKLVHRNS